jgi:hypothetical protein
MCATDSTLLKRAETRLQLFFSQLFINATYGKTIQDVRSLLDCKFCLTKKHVTKWVGNPRFRSMRIISEKLVVVFLNRKTVLLNKPYSAGFVILERAKYFMYEMYYNFLQPALGDCEVLMSDTDSLMILVRNAEKTDNIKKIRSVMDFSNYPPSHKLYSLSKKNQLGCFKDECAGAEIDEFCGLRSKTYAFTLNNFEKTKTALHSKAKGVTKAYKKNLSFAKYKKCLLSYDTVQNKQFHIRAKDHNVYTTSIQRLSFSSYDDKRWIFSGGCNIHSVPYYSKLISKDADICPFCKIHNPLARRYST